MKHLLKDGTQGDDRRSAGYFLTIALLILIVFQGFALSGHIHRSPILALSHIVQQDGAADTEQNIPVDDGDSCPVCYQQAQAGHFVLPSAVALYSPTEPVSVIAITIAAPFILSIPASFWQGRAPPRH